MCFAPQPRALFLHLNFQKWSGAEVFCTFWLRNVLRATTACTFSTSQLPKVVRTWCFVHFDLEMCFAPQRRALFRHLNFQKWSDAGVFCTFWLGNVLRATTACTFSTSQLPKVVRPWCVLYILTSKRASRHNGMQFFISHLASWLRTRRFSEPTFRPSGAKSLEKHRVSRLSYLFAHLHLLSSYSFSSTLLFSNLSLLSASSLLCFSSVHIVGSLTSKLPSNIKYLLILKLLQLFIVGDPSLVLGGEDYQVLQVPSVPSGPNLMCCLRASLWALHAANLQYIHKILPSMYHDIITYEQPGVWLLGAGHDIHTDTLILLSGHLEDCKGTFYSGSLRSLRGKP